MSKAMDSQLRAPRAACWMSHMRRGAFEAAWTISDAVLRARAGMHTVTRAAGALLEIAERLQATRARAISP